jgi:hypothetical protein
MSAYKEDFPRDSWVRIQSSYDLARFTRPTWTYHHPLSEEQLKCTGAMARVAGVAFYHGGDPLYTLEGLAGLWHEGCLEAIDLAIS